MSANAETTTSQEIDNENACCVCFKPCLIFSIGSCNHAVCFECSARMRTLLLQNECPICRQDLPKVIFTKTVAPFATLDRELRTGLYEKKFRIVFADLEIQKAFYRLLEIRCSECNHQPFVEFYKLKEHVRKVHELFFCEICTDNLKIFSNERRCYTRQQLATHRRVGDANDKSHKGHPRCEYCELRFLDKDELFRHLRREHFFCHLCDADGINLFYGAINEMREHFKSEHFLCEEEECVDEQFTAVFRSEIDLRAHIAVAHSKNMSKSAVKQARTLDLEFSYTPRGRNGGAPDHSRGGRIRTNDTQREFDRIPEQPIVQQAPIKIDSKNDEQFPSLGPSSGGPSVQLANTVRHINYGTSGLARTKENFPALGGLGAVEKPKNQNHPSTSGKQYKAPSASSMLKGPGNSSKQKSSGKKPASANLRTDNDFPALGPSMSSFAQPSALSRPVSSFSRPAAPAASSSSRIAASSSAPRRAVADFPALSQGNAKKNIKNEQMMEDMVETTSNVNLNLVKSKHRGLVEDYVSMASQVSKVQTVQQRDIEPVHEAVKKNVPKLNSVDNFPTLGSASAEPSAAPQWLTVGAKSAQKKEIKGKKVHEAPVISNGMTKLVKGEKKQSNGNKENKNESQLGEKNFPAFGSDPPPGFSNTPQKTKKPPPGFNSLSSARNVNNNIENSTEYTYLPPANASKRNQGLISEFQKALTSPESMQEFRNVSQMFRDGNYFAKSYYETCRHVLGAGFDTIFPELLALLPDIEKQQSLYAAHLEAAKSDDSAKSKKKNKSKELDVCATCQQVLLTSDLLTHVQSHALENNFPVLSVNEATTAKQWKK